jgi:hypothetical protein
MTKHEPARNMLWRAEGVEMTLFGKLFDKRHGSSDETTDLVANLKLLASAEANISTFYSLCAGTDTQEKDLWASMAAAESGHAEALGKMASLIMRNPKRYRPGQVFNSSAIRLFSLRMEGLTEKMKAGHIPPETLFSLAQEIENSAIELSISRLVETDDEECNRIARRVDAESREHRNALEKAARGKAPNSSAETP